MICINSLEAFKPFSKPITLIIGNFDGVHLGHLHVIHHAVDYSKKVDGHTVLLTFSNHPSEILQPKRPVKLLCTPVHKHKLLSEQKIDTLVELPFTKTFSKQNAKEFLFSLRQFIPFVHLVLGHDATIGKNRHGDKNEIYKLAEEFGFTVDYVDPLIQNAVTLSSSKIRASISKGNFEQASTMLGRPYSILGSVQQGNQIGQELGFPTANINVMGLCLPPYGVYSVQMRVDNAFYDGIANLGIAPTIRNSLNPVLEVFLFEKPGPLLNKNVEVFLQNHIRDERTFFSKEALIEQIKEDIKLCKLEKRA